MISALLLYVLFCFGFNLLFFSSLPKYVLVSPSYFACMHEWLTKSCPILWDLVDCSPPGSSVHRKKNFQARMLEWVAIFFSSRSSQPKDQTHVSCISCIDRQFLYKLSHWESPFSSGFPTQPLVPMAVSLLVGSVLVNFNCLCPPVLSLQFWQLWFALWPHFPSWLKKSWFFILLCFLLLIKI